MGLDGVNAFGGAKVIDTNKKASHYNLAKPPKSLRPPLNGRPGRKESGTRPSDPNLDFNLTGAGFSQTPQKRQIPVPRAGQPRRTTTASFGVRSSSARGLPKPPSLPSTSSSN